MLDGRRQDWAVHPKASAAQNFYLDIDIFQLSDCDIYL